MHNHVQLFYSGAGDLNSGPHAWAANTLRLVITHFFQFHSIKEKWSTTKFACRIRRIFCFSIITIILKEHTLWSWSNPCHLYKSMHVLYTFGYKIYRLYVYACIIILWLHSEKNIFHIYWLLLRCLSPRQVLCAQSWFQYFYGNYVLFQITIITFSTFKMIAKIL